ncbi:MAG: ABC transporter ATP-binding protein [Oscillospiraceae bacterium]|jgi:ABC-type nitrate/sulfonate/bicarbonate transport system ATPase subunit|nr:ABC transporter ATP-binding protein [Oscillospiraceae bacterium]
MSVAIRNLNKRFFVDGNAIPVLNNINLEVRQGEFITIVGQSGCGKSTLLKMIAGLESITEGEILRNGKPVTAPGTDCGMVFQDHRLLPWLRVKRNVGFGLRCSKAEREHIAAQHLQLVGLSDFANAWPHQLSGGMAQRAAIARGLATNPALLLLDEPFGALDALTRIQLQREVLRIWHASGATMVLVTHDIDEAIFLGERVVVMSARPGEISEVIPIPPGVGADRGSLDFARYKDRILKYFFADEKSREEYNI